MPISTTSWSIQGSDDRPILGNSHRPGDEVTPRGVLICCHGFKGYKDYGFLPRLADHAAQAGLIAHRFNFSHSGMTNHIQTFEHPERFEQDTWSKQIYDIGRVVEQVAEPEGLPIVVFGHSRGGLAALLASASLNDRVAGVVTAASPADACTLDDQQRGILRRTGRLASPSGRTGQMLHVGRGWLEEIENDPSRFDPLISAASLDCPALFLHGDDDATVPLQAMHRYQAAAPHQQSHLIPQANHTFNAPNPLPPDAPLPPQTAELFDQTLRFANACVSSADG